MIRRAACAASLGVVALVVAAACADSSPPAGESRPAAREATARATPKDASPSPTRAVTLALAPSIRGNQLTVEGFTNLPDGALISYEVTHENPSNGRVLRGVILVKDEKFTTTLSVKGWPAGEIEIWAAFQTILGRDQKQPPEIIERYGEMGQRIEGNQATVAGALRRVEVQRTVVKR